MIREANHLRSGGTCCYEGAQLPCVHHGSKSRVLYIGMSNNLERRVFEHQHDLIDGFSTQYRCHRLVYFEAFDRVQNAIAREKQLKRWNRSKKVWLIERMNPTWEDLSGGKVEQQVSPLAS